MEPNLSIIGLGKIGSCFAAVAASQGFKVIGVDIDQRIISKINSGQAPTAETNLQNLISKCHDRLSATSSTMDAVNHTNITFVIVPTPTNYQGIFDNQFIINAITQIGQAIRNKTQYHLVVILSTVMPGSMGGILKKTLQTASGKQLGQDIGLCYSPQFIALGSVINNLLHPDFVLVGASDIKAYITLAQIYEKICDGSPQILHMNFINVEIAKLSLNTFITMKISYSNMISELCDKFENADVDAITKVLGMDSRINPKYLKAATAYGGPCFPRDNLAFSKMAEQLNCRADIAKATDAINRHQVERLAKHIKTYFSCQSIAILGLSYKLNTTFTEESAGVKLANHLAQLGYRIFVYDPTISDMTKIPLLKSINVIDRLQNSLCDTDMSIIMLNCQKLRRMLASLLLNTSTVNISGYDILDCWRLFNKNELPPHVNLHYLGYGTEKKYHTPVVNDAKNLS